MSLKRQLKNRAKRVLATQIRFETCLWLGFLFHISDVSSFQGHWNSITGILSCIEKITCICSGIPMILVVIQQECANYSGDSRSEISFPSAPAFKGMDLHVHIYQRLCLIWFWLQMRTCHSDKLLNWRQWSRCYFNLYILPYLVSAAKGKAEVHVHVVRRPNEIFPLFPESHQMLNIVALNILLSSSFQHI